MLASTSDSAHDREHIYRVLYNALAIARTEENVDYDILIAACLLHDVGRPEQFADPNNFTLFFHNESGMAMTVSAGDILVNGIDLPHASLVCKARPGEIGKGWLEVDLGEWEAAGIQEIHTLSFSLTGLGQDGRIHFETDEIYLIAEGADDIWENS